MMGGGNKYAEKQEMTQVKVSGDDGGVGREADWKTERCRQLLQGGYCKAISLDCDCTVNGA